MPLNVKNIPKARSPIKEMKSRKDSREFLSSFSICKVTGLSHFTEDMVKKTVFLIMPLNKATKTTRIQR